MTAPSSLRVLVVDDDAHVLRFVGRALHAFGYLPALTGSANQAIRITQRFERLDVLITDLKMPEMSGEDLAARIREHVPDVKVLYLTGYRDRLFRDKAALQDTEAFLQKPCSIKALEDSVSRLVNGQPAGEPA